MSGDPTLIRLTSGVDALFARAHKLVRILSDSDFEHYLETQADIAKHACVSVSGVLDAGVAHIYASYIQAKAAPQVQKFAIHTLGRLANLNSNRLVELAMKFDTTWAAELDAFLVDETKDAIDSLVANRNNIAHGRPVSVGIVQVERYFARVKVALAFLEGLVNEGS